MILLWISSIYICPSASQTLLPTVRRWEMQAYKCFRNMTLHFSAGEFFVFLLIIYVFGTENLVPLFRSGGH